MHTALVILASAALAWTSLAALAMAYFSFGRPDREPSRLALAILAPFLICEAVTRPISWAAHRLLVASPRNKSTGS